MGRKRLLRLLQPGNSFTRTIARVAKKFCERRGNGLNLPLRKLKTTCGAQAEVAAAKKILRFRRAWR